MPDEFIAAPRYQFSLRTAFLLMVLAAAGASLWISIRADHENARLMQENTRLRNEVGELTIEPGNENKVHAIAVPELEDRTWRFRVYIPDGRPFGLQSNTKNGYGSGSNWLLLSSGEHTIVVALRRGLSDRWEWVVHIVQESGPSGSRLSASPNVEKFIANYHGNSVGYATKSVEPGADLELLNFELTGPNANGSTANESIAVTIHEGPAGK